MPVKSVPKGWNRLEPLHARLPLPWVVLLAFAAVIAHNGWGGAALALVLGRDNYPWPGRLLGITAEMVFPPRPRYERSSLVTRRLAALPDCPVASRQKLAHALPGLVGNLRHGR